MEKYRPALPRIMGYFMLILIMLITLGLGLQIIGVFSMGEFLRPVLSALGLLDSPVPLDGEDPFLLEKERLAQREDALLIQKEEVDSALRELEEMEIDFQLRLAALEERERIQEDREISFNETLKQAETKRANLEAVSQYLTGMPPQSAVAILNEMEVQDVIDIMRTVDQAAQEAGTNSIVAFWLNLISQERPERAAEIQRLMVRKPSS